MGEGELQRQANYRALFKVHVSDKLITELRKATNSGLALGGDTFVEQVESLSGRRLRLSRLVVLK